MYTYLMTLDFTGLMDMNIVNYSKAIDHVLPGHIETYELDSNGKATFGGSMQFHSVEDAPIYKTPVDNLGI